jgi:1,3-beta-galactosyl-N-acetylhexosamine phosphorylase
LLFDFKQNIAGCVFPGSWLDVTLQLNIFEKISENRKGACMGSEKININEGAVTLPSEVGKEKETCRLFAKWGADAIRDSDGTELSPAILKMGFRVYSTLCLVRLDEEWAKNHPEELIQKFLMSEKIVALSETVEIDLMAEYFSRKYKVDTVHNPKVYWEVINRTTSDIVPVSDWDYNEKTGKVTIKNARKFNIYTVNFLVFQTWDTTSMYNHLANKWNARPKGSVDPFKKQTRKHLLDILDKWLENHPGTDVVRLTSLYYHFTLDSDANGNPKFVDGTYTDCVSIEALEAFEKCYGYKLRSEDFVNEGYYNTTTRIPSQAYLDWKKFIHDFVIKYTSEIVDRIHRAGKKAALYLGDHIIGAEPYSDDFKDMNFDILIQACHNGVWVRQVSDIPGSHIKELRLYPYFFQNIFINGDNAISISTQNWMKIRRAMLRKMVDRIGYGGYLSVALPHQNFIDHITDLCNQFRELLGKSGKTTPYSYPVKVMILNSQGKSSRWKHTSTIIEKSLSTDTEVMQDSYLECLAGLPFEITFKSFSDIINSGIDGDVAVIINAGDAGSPASGGNAWANEKLMSIIREWIYNGGGFIGMKNPSAYEYQGQFFQLADVLGVDKEVGNTIHRTALRSRFSPNHFIVEDFPKDKELSPLYTPVFASSKDIDVILKKEVSVDCNSLNCFDKNKPPKVSGIELSVNQYGRGRAVYMVDLPYNYNNSRVLLRSILWAAGKEGELKRWFSSNPKTDCAAFPETGWWAVANLDSHSQMTTIYQGNGEPMELELGPNEIKWNKIVLSNNNTVEENTCAMACCV